MWGTDGVRVFTLDDGWGWIFAAVEHWNAECVGWHVCKVGSRFAALDPIAQGLERLYGSLDADVARGLALRMDHGSQYLSDHFLKQIRYWGIHPSFGFVEEPETNGVAERWNRTLKEQAIHGRIFQNLEAVRAAVADFVERYNQTWRLEKRGDRQTARPQTRRRLNRPGRPLSRRRASALLRQEPGEYQVGVAVLAATDFRLEEIRASDTKLNHVSPTASTTSRSGPCRVPRLLSRCTTGHRPGHRLPVWPR